MASPLYIHLSFVVPYSCSAHPPVVALSNVRVYAFACMRAGDAAGGRESRVYGTRWPPQESFPESRDGGRLPALISGRFDLRIFIFFTAPSFLTISAPSALPLSRCALRYPWILCAPVQRSCPPGGMLSLRQNHGKHPRAYCARPGIKGTSPQMQWQSVHAHYNVHRDHYCSVES